MGVEGLTRGFVIRIKGSDYYVSGGGEEVCCRLKGSFRLEESPEEVLPVVGDVVEFRRETGHDFRGPRGLIVSLLPRKSIFARSSPSEKKGFRVLGANLDCVFLVFSVAQPSLNLRLLDRMLVAAECGRMEPMICINKMDLVDGENGIREEIQPYLGMGYELILCSALSGLGLERLKSEISGKSAIMVGPSGTGKTSLISALQPGLELRIERVSARTGKGKHTTTHFELHPLECGGYLGDSPGIREFGIWGLKKDDLGDYFRDFCEFQGRCRFTKCTHSHEPGCAVKGAVGEKAISKRRYESYLRILDTLPEKL